MPATDRTEELIAAVKRADPATIELMLAVIAEADMSARWTKQVGAMMTRKAVARLLGKSEQAVAQDKNLFWVLGSDGRVFYPVRQFNGSSPVPGLKQVLDVLRLGGEAEYSILSWLTSKRTNGNPMFERLRDGELDDVLVLARKYVQCH